MKRINIPLPDDLIEALDAYSKDNGILKKKVVELALRKYLEEESG